MNKPMIFMCKDTNQIINMAHMTYAYRNNEGRVVSYFPGGDDDYVELHGDDAERFWGVLVRYAKEFECLFMD